MIYRITGNFCGNLISAVFCGQLRTAEIKIAEYYVKYYVQNTFSNSNSDSAISVKYLIIHNYYIQIRCQTTNSPIRAWNIYESSPFSRKKFLSLCSIVKTTEWNGLIKIDN